VLLKPFIKKLAGHLDGKNIFIQLDRFDWLKPGFETLNIHIVFNNLQTILPDIFCGSAHHFISGWSSVRGNTVCHFESIKFVFNNDANVRQKFFEKLTHAY
jgi:hypothetical protein